MYTLVALVSYLAVASASICCIPPQWEGYVGFLVGLNRNGKGNSATGSAAMAYDGVRRVIGQSETVTRNTDGQSITIDALLDFNGDTKYIRSGGHCIKTKLNQKWRDGCIPDNATVVSTNAMFGFGSNMVPINSYRMDYGGVMTSSFSVTAQGCIPVLNTVRGTLDGVTFMQSLGYVNISAGLSDPLSLNVPPVGCENAPMVQAHYVDGMFTPGMVGKRSLFGFFH